VRINVAELAIPHCESPIANYVTVSLGLFTVSDYADICVKEIVTKADQQLYQAKENGRNQLSFAQTACYDA
jgi:diguanylate cyclase (GGDEF)-like protein